ncbi:hypothetical protein E3N88_24918 [Mikania micrantha]|uniref:Aminotransferase-like plant mobile domain-containing protein n=1 Tax=Mikania micrantha TaxID=192012 RepID=A0A5N6N4X4_9ASTR|nr:hypothetical protein E3N88_24918 [Mikania micrantha]
MAQHKSPMFIRVRKRARSEVNPLDTEDISPNNWLSQLDLNIRPNSQDQDRSMIPKDFISQVPDTMMDSSSIEMLGGENDLGVSMVKPSTPQSRVNPDAMQDKAQSLNSEVNLEEGEFRYPMSQMELQKEIDATIVIAEKVGIKLVDHQEAVKAAIIGEGSGGESQGTSQRLGKEQDDFDGVPTGEGKSQVVWLPTLRILGEKGGLKEIPKFEFEGVGANGRSGGLLSIWDPGIFQKDKVIAKKNFLLTSGKVTGNSSERLNSEFNPQGANLFNQFIFNAQLLEYNMSGHPYTFMRGFGSSYNDLNSLKVVMEYYDNEASIRSLTMDEMDDWAATKVDISSIESFHKEDLKHKARCPLVNDLLFLAGSHRVDYVFQRCEEIRDCGLLRIRRGDEKLWVYLRKNPITENVLQYIRLAGFSGVIDCETQRLDSALISSPVERWRPETHTFHMPFGEVTVTLQDVAVLLGFSG